jgi:hypothetical protein
MLKFREAKLGRVLLIYLSSAFAVVQAVDLFQLTVLTADQRRRC